jgi:hypothetical protein
MTPIELRSLQGRRTKPLWTSGALIVASAVVLLIVFGTSTQRRSRARDQRSLKKLHGNLRVSSRAARAPGESPGLCFDR